MNLRALLPALCVVIGAASGCSRSANVTADPGDGQAFARALAESAAWAELSRPGVEVCKLLHIGIAEHDWVRGIVVEVHKPAVRVRITDPGRFIHELDGVALTAGAVVDVAPAGWTPCK